VVAPAGIFDPAGLEAGMALLRQWGLEPVPSPHLGARDRYTAGSVALRQADLAWALGEPGLAAAWFARGGYGTMHLLPELGPLPRDERPIIGFSDATALFCALDRQRRGLRVHGPVLHSLAEHPDAATRQALRALLLEGRRPRLPGRQLAGPTGPVQGRLVGGNLCVLASLAGTPWALDARDAIVVLEDVAEPPYKLDRMLSQLLLSGGLAGARGIALGSFTRTPLPAGATWGAEDVLVALLAPLGLPVVGGLPVGHDAANLPWLHGAPAVLDEDGVHALD